MAALASVDDVADLLGLASEGVDTDRATALLAQASATFRAEARNDFEEVETTMVLRNTGGKVQLPYRPVTAIDTVKTITADGTAGTAISAWSFDGIHTIRLNDYTVVINAAVAECDTVEVTWTHGFTAVPEDVRWSVAQMVARTISSPTPAGVTGETIGAYSYSINGAVAFGGAMVMSSEEVAVARRYRPRESSAYISL